MHEYFSIWLIEILKSIELFKKFTFFVKVTSAFVFISYFHAHFMIQKWKKIIFSLKNVIFFEFFQTSTSQSLEKGKESGVGCSGAFVANRKIPSQNQTNFLWSLILELQNSVYSNFSPAPISQLFMTNNLHEKINELFMTYYKSIFVRLRENNFWGKLGRKKYIFGILI